MLSHSEASEYLRVAATTPTYIVLVCWHHSLPKGVERKLFIRKLKVNIGVNIDENK